MAGYIIKYRDIVISAHEANKLAGRLVGMIKIVSMGDTLFDDIINKYPYSGYRKFDLEEQLNNKSLSRTLPRHIKEDVLNMPEVIIEMRNSKIEEIIKS